MKLEQQGSEQSEKDAGGCLQDQKEFFRQPTAREVSLLRFGESLDLSVYAQEKRNHFAHLLNRGSSLELFT